VSTAGPSAAPATPICPLIERVAAETKEPNFIYLLTLNTHILVVPGEALTKFGCERAENGFGLRRVCRMAELWHDVFQAVAQLALDPSHRAGGNPRGRRSCAAASVPEGARGIRGRQGALYRLTPRAGVVVSNAHRSAESVGAP
jgi:hypothetical protein